MSTPFTRRSFLKATTASVAGLTLAGEAVSRGAVSHSKRKFMMALSCGMIGVRASQTDAIDLAGRFGFEAVEPSPDYLAGLSDDALGQLLAKMKAKNLAWSAAGLPVEFRGDEATFASTMKPLADFARGLRRAGVTRVGTWLNPSHGSLTYLANFRQHARRLRQVAQVLSDQGCRLGLEYVGPKTAWSSARFPFVHTMAEMKDLIAETGCQNVGFMLDSWHWYTAHETQADILSLSSADVVCCHLNDAPKGIPVDRQMDNHRDLPAATGVIDVKAFLGGLAKIGYDGPVMAEPFRSDLGTLPREKVVEMVAAAMRKAFAMVE